MNINRFDALPTARDVFDEFFRGLPARPSGGLSFRGEVTGARASSARLAVDVTEEDGAYKVRADLPGVKKDDIRIQIDGDVLTISAESKGTTEKRDGERVVYSERYTGKVARSFRIGGEIEWDKAVAKYENGVLELDLPKKASAAVKKLTVH